MTDYEELDLALSGLVSGVPHPIANLANASALIFDALESLNWAGFYLIDKDRPVLVLGPFQGKPACIEIPLGRGVCGTAAEEDRTLVVDNVHEFPGHIACDCASNSEIVIPLHGRDGSVVGVLDIDSPVFSRFDENDRIGLERMAKTLEKELGL